MNAYAQAAATLPPVSQTSGIDWPLLLGILAVVGIVALVVWYKHKNPAGAAAAGSVVSADAVAIGKALETELGKLRDLVERKVVPAPAAAPADQTAALTQVTAERDALQAKLDDIKAKLA